MMTIYGSMVLNPFKKNHVAKNPEYIVTSETILKNALSSDVLVLQRFCKLSIQLIVIQTANLTDA